MINFRGSGAAGASVRCRAAHDALPGPFLAWLPGRRPHQLLHATHAVLDPRPAGVRRRLSWFALGAEAPSSYRCILGPSYPVLMAVGNRIPTSGTRRRRTRCSRTVGSSSRVRSPSSNATMPRAEAPWHASVCSISGGNLRLHDRIDDVDGVVVAVVRQVRIALTTVPPRCQPRM